MLILVAAWKAVSVVKFVLRRPTVVWFVSIVPLLMFVVLLCKVVLPPMVEPRVMLVVLLAVALVPMLMVWVAEPPAAAPMEMVLVAVEFPRTIPPVLLLVPMV